MSKEHILPKGFDLDGVSMKGKTVVLQTDIEDNFFESRRRVEIPPEQGNLWCGCTDFVFPNACSKVQTLLQGEHDTTLEAT